MRVVLVSSNRGGTLVRQPEGYDAFRPAPLPPSPPLELDMARQHLLSRADQALGRLDGIVDTVPDPDVFVWMYVRREAVLSSQIEGTQSTLEDLLAIEAAPDVQGVPEDVDEIVNYVAAMNHGLARLTELPISLRLIREIHGILLAGVRGADRRPGEFRGSQNFIGPAGARLEEATFVPPSVHDMHPALADFERFLNRREPVPDLILAGLAHAQFETIHPFHDGNGRIGRLLITFLLVQRGALRRPLLYLSIFLKAHRQEYYDRLMAIRSDGDWEGWLDFFLRGVADAAEEATATAKRIFDLRETHRQLVIDARMGQYALPLLAMMFRQPVLNVNRIKDELRTSFGTANTLVARMVDAGLLEEITGGRRGRLFRYEPYLELLRDRPLPEGPRRPAMRTGVA